LPASSECEEPPKIGPDFSEVDDPKKVQKLADEGTLEKLFLMPLELIYIQLTPNAIVAVKQIIKAGKTRVRINDVLDWAMMTLSRFVVSYISVIRAS